MRIVTLDTSKMEAAVPASRLAGAGCCLSATGRRALSSDFPLGDSLEVFIRREDAERFAHLWGTGHESHLQLRSERNNHALLARTTIRALPSAHARAE